MSLSFAVIGPGRVGTALARRWRENGLECVGFVGRDAAAVERARAFVGAGEALTASRLQVADVVAVTVTDGAIAAVVGGHAPAGARPGALWLHTSGLVGLDALRPAAERGSNVGALHPLCPFPDAERGYRGLPGRVAVLESDEHGMPTLETLAGAAELRAVAVSSIERPLYHAACALAANGVTALVGTAAALLARATGLPERDATAIASDLAAAAVRETAASGAASALSGPVRRGDAAVVARHREALRRESGSEAAARAYRAVMLLALRFATDAGLDPEAVAAVRAVLDEAAGG